METDLTQSKSASPVSWPLIGSLIQLMRPREWIKNAFVGAPLIFSGLFLKSDALLKVVFAFFLFCLASSAAYILNDLFDRSEDALHRNKSARPLALGTVTPQQAQILLGFLCILLILGLFYLPIAALPVTTYLLLNIVYSYKLKQLPVIDLFCIAAGFVLRVYAGAVVLGVPLSTWMLITTLCIALYLAAIKRLEELKTNGAHCRQVLKHYTAALLERYAQVAAVTTIVFYGLFVITVRPQLDITLPWVLFGLFRYWYITENDGGGESPSAILWKDGPLLFTLLSWGCLCLYALWPRP
jgi:4-hydroxybenzoate polyprenyltransferase